MKKKDFWYIYSPGPTPTHQSRVSVGCLGVFFITLFISLILGFFNLIFLIIIIYLNI